MVLHEIADILTLHHSCRSEKIYIKMSYWKAFISTIDTTPLDIFYTRVVSSDPREGVLAPPTTPYWGGGG